MGFSPTSRSAKQRRLPEPISPQGGTGIASPGHRAKKRPSGVTCHVNMTSDAAKMRYLVRGVSGLQQQVGDQGEGIETKPIDPALERGLQQKKGRLSQ